MTPFDRRASDLRLASRIAKDHGLTPEQLIKAVVREQRRKPKGDRLAVGE